MCECMLVAIVIVSKSNNHVKHARMLKLGAAIVSQLWLALLVNYGWCVNPIYIFVICIIRTYKSNTYFQQVKECWLIL